MPKTVQPSPEREVLRFQYLQKEVDLEIERREARKESQQEAKARKLLACKWPGKTERNVGRANQGADFSGLMGLMYISPRGVVFPRKQDKEDTQRAAKAALAAAQA